MPIGVSPAPEIFQRCLEQLLVGLEGVTNIHDDMLIMGVGDTFVAAAQNHDARLKGLLKRCSEKGIVLNNSEENFIFWQPQSPSMGHVFTDNKLNADPEKITAINNMPVPDDVTAVRCFLGMSTYLSTFIPDLANMS